MTYNGILQIIGAKKNEETFLAGLEDLVLNWLSQYVYNPWMVYSFVWAMMLASGFGLPVPEEITLISVGLIAYMARHPELYPPPASGVEAVDLTTLALTCFFAVLFSDTLVYGLGRFFGTRITQSALFKKIISEEKLKKIEGLAHKYSYWVCGIFRFTPGIRFPGHISCGMTKISWRKFFLVDGAAVILSVPTQVILVAMYGETIIGIIKKVNQGIFKIIIVAVLAFIIYKVYQARAAAKKERSESQLDLKK